MGTIKRLALSSAATLVAITGAQAADMPIAPAREPVYRCDLSGFYEIPGSDICLRISGHALFVTGGADRDNIILFDPYGNGPGTSDDPFFMHSQFRVRFDARSATRYGTVRAFAELQAEDNSQNTGGALDLRQGFVQFGNWLFGKAWSTFLLGLPGPSYSDPYSTIAESTQRLTMVRYTQPFGNGFAIAAAIENPSHRSVDEPILAVVNEVPNIVGALTYSNERVEASLGGALVWNERFDGVDTDDDLGFALQTAIGISLPELSDGSQIGLRGIYADGATEYAPDNLRGGRNVGMVAGIINQTVETWAVEGWLTYVFTPTIAGTLTAGYGERDAGAGTVSAIQGDLEIFEVTGNVAWTPVENLEFMIDVHYNDVQATSIAGIVTENDDITVIGQVKRSF